MFRGHSNLPLKNHPLNHHIRSDADRALRLRLPSGITARLLGTSSSWGPQELDGWFIWIYIGLYRRKPTNLFKMDDDFSGEFTPFYETDKPLPKFSQNAGFFKKQPKKWWFNWSAPTVNWPQRMLDFRRGMSQGSNAGSDGDLTEYTCQEIPELR